MLMPFIRKPEAFGLLPDGDKQVLEPAHGAAAMPRTGGDQHAWP